jgi:UDP-N-acetylglucosamine--N-acetylmuramyl-(pentapeptide) pyrophosphoryl-undecaprenol N-acetylglucosamine transferase
VLVPLPGAPSDHQTRNARTLEEAGAGVVLPDAECDGARLDAMCSRLLADGPRVAEMSAAAHGLARVDAAAALAARVEEHARAR